jgi:hypothetical protein
MNHKNKHFFVDYLPYCVKNVLPLCRNLLSPFLGWNNGSFEMLEPPYQATGLHNAENIDSKNKIKVAENENLSSHRYST